MPEAIAEVLLLLVCQSS